MSNQIEQLTTRLPIELVQAKSSANAPNSDHTQELKKVCEDFESIFIAQLMKTMRASIEKSGLFEENAGTDIYQSMFDFEVSNKIAHSGSFGIAEMIFKSLSGQPTENDNWDQPYSIRAGFQRDLGATGSVFNTISRHHNIISEAAKKYDMPIDLVYGVIAQESAGRSDVVSRAGAKGLMQLMDGTAAELGVKNPFDPQENIFAGVAYLKEQLNRFNGNVELALAAYNAGPSSVERYGGVPPYAETQDYVKKVMTYVREFEPQLQQEKSETI
jgi:Rod binding domain-containing protein